MSWMGSDGMLGRCGVCGGTWIDKDVYSNCPKGCLYSWEKSKERIFCKNCKFIDVVMKSFNPECISLNNKFFEKRTTFYSEETIIIKKLPSEINKNNDCNWFEAGENLAEKNFNNFISKEKIKCK